MEAGHFANFESADNCSGSGDRRPEVCCITGGVPCPRAGAADCDRCWRNVHHDLSHALHEGHQRQISHQQERHAEEIRAVEAAGQDTTEALQRQAKELERTKMRDPVRKIVERTTHRLFPGQENSERVAEGVQRVHVVLSDPDKCNKLAQRPCHQIPAHIAHLARNKVIDYGREYRGGNRGGGSERPRKPNPRATVPLEPDAVFNSSSLPPVASPANDQLTFERIKATLWTILAGRKKLLKVLDAFLRRFVDGIRVDLLATELNMRPNTLSRRFVLIKTAIRGNPLLPPELRELLLEDDTPVKRSRGRPRNRHRRR